MESRLSSSDSSSSSEDPFEFCTTSPPKETLQSLDAAYLELL